MTSIPRSGPTAGAEPVRPAAVPPMLRRERIERLIWLAVMAAFGLVAVIGGLSYGLEVEDRVGPGAMPFAAGLLILIPLVLEAVRLLRAPVQEDALAEPAATAGSPGPAGMPAPPEEAPTSRPRTPHVGVIFALIAATVALSWLVGLLIAVSLLVGVLFLLNDRRRPLVALTAMVIAGLFGWIVFATLLDVPLPSGLLGLI